MFTLFYLVYPYLPLFTLVYPYFTLIYPYLPLFYPYFTLIYPYLPECIPGSLRKAGALWFEALSGAGCEYWLKHYLSSGGGALAALGRPEAESLRGDQLAAYPRLPERSSFRLAVPRLIQHTRYRRAFAIRVFGAALLSTL